MRKQPAGGVCPFKKIMGHVVKCPTRQETGSKRINYAQGCKCRVRGVREELGTAARPQANTKVSGLPPRGSGEPWSALNHEAPCSKGATDTHNGNMMQNQPRGAPEARSL